MMNAYGSYWFVLNWYGHVCRYVPRPDQWHRRGLRWCGAACSNFSVSLSVKMNFLVITNLNFGLHKLVCAVLMCECCTLIFSVFIQYT